MVLVKATSDSEEGKMPSSEMLEKMGRYNEELVKAGIMLAGEGTEADIERQAHRVRRCRSHGHRWPPSPRPRNSSRATGSGRSRTWTRRLPG